MLNCISTPTKQWWVMHACLVAQLWPTLYDPMDCSLLGSFVYGIFQARILEWEANPFFRGSSWCRDRIPVFCIAGWFFTIWATREAPEDEIVKEHHWLNGCEFEQTPGDFPDPGIEPRSPALQADALPSEPPGKPQSLSGKNQNKLEL